MEKSNNKKLNDKGTIGYSVVLFLSVVISACSGGDGDSASSETLLASPNLVNQSITLNQNEAITGVLFSNSGGGELSDCLYDSASFPQGLSVTVSNDANTCLISGTPTMLQTSSSYSITAVNDSGRNNAQVTIEVVSPTFVAPNLQSSSPLTLLINQTLSGFELTNSGGGLSECYSDSLPSGLSVSTTSDGSTCQISGIPQTLVSNTSYTIVASYIDINGQTSQQSIDIIITVEPEEAAFVTTWNTALPGGSDDNQIQINSIEGNYSVYWGDGKSDTNISGSIVHTYDAEGEYTVKIIGDFKRIFFEYQTVYDQALDELISDREYHDNKKLLSIDQWGDIKWTSMENAFRGAENMQMNALDVPDLSQVSSTAAMFIDASLFNGYIGDWDVSKVNIMSAMFCYAESFNQPLHLWDVSSVFDMSAMFLNASAFDQDLGGWDISSISSDPGPSMRSMFFDAKMSTENYSSTLIGWQATAPAGVVFDGGLSMYNNAAAEARDVLTRSIDGRSWTITDGGPDSSQ